MARVKRLLTAASMTLSALRSAARSPADAVLTVRIALFIARLPADLGRQDVASFLRELRSSPRPPCADVHAGVARVKRIRDAVLSLPRYWQRNTCYVRALTLYRFVDAGERRLRLHFGIERQERLHGHLWLTLDRELLEAPDGVMLSALREVPFDVVA